MSERPEDGVVDPNLAVHGVPNLHVASSSAFVTSSHANSTFMILVLALRLAEHLSRELADLRRGRGPEYRPAGADPRPFEEVALSLGAGDQAVDVQGPQRVVANRGPPRASAIAQACPRRRA